MQRRRVVAIAIGLAAGVASGLLGVGGGVVMVPGLALMCGLSQHRANATSLAAIVPIGATGALVFAAAGHVDYGLAVLLSLGAVAGAPIGVRWMARVPEPALRGIFVSVAVVVAVRLLR